MELNAGDIFLIICYGVVFLSGTIGNGLVVKWFGTKKERKRAGNKLVVVLAINDFLSSIFVPLLQIHFIISLSLTPRYLWYLGEGLCRTLFGIQVTFLIATSWLLIAISLERYR